MTGPLAYRVALLEGVAEAARELLNRLDEFATETTGWGAEADALDNALACLGPGACAFAGCLNPTPCPEHETNPQWLGHVVGCTFNTDDGWQCAPDCAAGGATQRTA